jgi:hypothetical protein
VRVFEFFEGDVENQIISQIRLGAMVPFFGVSSPLLKASW